MMADNSTLYWVGMVFIIVIVFGAIAYPSSYLGRKIKHKRLKPAKKLHKTKAVFTIMENQVEDNAVKSHIRKLTDREEHLFGKENITDDDIKELHLIQSELDQYWDLLHQRRAFRDAGEDPKLATMRAKETIKKYVK
jgi:hypothetical protein